jgi:hypothetical protein
MAYDLNSKNIFILRPMSDRVISAGTERVGKLRQLFAVSQFAAIVAVAWGVSTVPMDP